ncbi:MAG: DUF996 domain-containing protein [Thermoprotei archaeon]|nr:DUF996 domain-containing protein [Thermoprotei archaeon]
MEFNTAKKFGLGGAVLMILFWPVGILLLLKFLSYLAQVYGERRIFNYMLYWLALTVLLPLLLLFLAFILSVQMPDVSVPLSALLFFLAFFVLPVFGCFLFYKSMSLLASKSNINHFKISGLLILIGAVFIGAALMVSVLVGVVFGEAAFEKAAFILSFVGPVGGVMVIASFIVLAIAFYKLKPPVTLPTSVQT